jgi:hypothetical protein
MEHPMTSRTLLSSLALAILLGAPVAAIARAVETPADSSAATAPSTPAPDANAAPSSTSNESAAAAPADSASTAKDEVKGAKDEVKGAKEDAKDAIKEDSKKMEDKKDAAKKDREAAKKSAKKSAKKNKTEAAAAAKGTVKSVESAAAKPGTMPEKPSTPPQHVQVQHILIGFTGSVPGKAISRSKEEAKTLAYQILDRARKGEDFDELVKQYTDDSPPGIYGMSEKGLPPGPGEYPRDGMVAAFGNVGFNISVGNIGIADYDPQASPFGYHIIKRLK